MCGCETCVHACVLQCEGACVQDSVCGEGVRALAGRVSRRRAGVPVCACTGAGVRVHLFWERKAPGGATCEVGLVRARLGAGAVGGGGHTFRPADSLARLASPRARMSPQPAQVLPSPALDSPNLCVPLKALGTLGRGAAGLLALSHGASEKRLLQSHLGKQEGGQGHRSPAGSGLNGGCGEHSLQGVGAPSSPHPGGGP